MKKIVIPIIIVFFTLFLIIASEFIPQGNINLVSLYNITNATFLCNSTGSCFTLSELNTTNAGGVDTQKKAESFYLFNNTDEIFLNETSLNATIDNRASGLGDNVTWNQSFANTLYADAGNFFDQQLNITSNVTFGNIVPVTNNTYDLGNTSNFWSNIYVATINLITELVDSQISNTLTIDGTGSVIWSALTSYPSACTSSQTITTL